MSFSDEYQILIENMYFFKGYGAKDVLRNFRIRCGDCRDWMNFWKGCEKLAWRSSDGRQRTARTDDNIELFCFVFCNIHTRTGYYYEKVQGRGTENARLENEGRSKM